MVRRLVDLPCTFPGSQEGKLENLCRAPASPARPLLQGDSCASARNHMGITSVGQTPRKDRRACWAGPWGSQLLPVGARCFCLPGQGPSGLPGLPHSPAPF